MVQHDFICVIFICTVFQVAKRQKPWCLCFFYHYYACLGDPARVEAWRQVLLHGAHPGQGGEHAQDHPAGSHQG